MTYPAIYTLTPFTRWRCQLCSNVIDNGDCRVHPTAVHYVCDGCGLDDAWTPEEEK